MVKIKIHLEIKITLNKSSFVSNNDAADSNSNHGAKSDLRYGVQNKNYPQKSSYFGNAIAEMPHEDENEKQVNNAIFKILSILSYSLH